MDKRVPITYAGQNFEADINFDRPPYFHVCQYCGGDGRMTNSIIEEIVDMQLMEYVLNRSKIGQLIKKAIIERFDGKYICDDCLRKEVRIEL